jgi:hypothetical protein
MSDSSEAATMAADTAGPTTAARTRGAHATFDAVDLQEPDMEDSVVNKINDLPAWPVNSMRQTLSFHSVGVRGDRAGGGPAVSQQPGKHVELKHVELRDPLEACIQQLAGR